MSQERKLESNPLKTTAFERRLNKRCAADLGPILMKFVSYLNCNLAVFRD